ncbi:MAG: DegT/DnrJ/EryC1/StrS family aminotransferase [Candidatus Didemnitutus sp.]|nr:DegT/DnrJ/EryC1/StrS family aminotransferase [Candidatus Didemnitutus sp.]
MRNDCSKRSALRGEVDKYTWTDAGSSYVMSDLLAAFLYGQLEIWPQIQAKRQHLWSRYHAELASWAKSLGATRPIVPEHCNQAWHMYYLLLPDLATRSALIAHLREQRIHTVFHYQPLHLSPYAQSWNGAPGDCPVTENTSDRLLRLPFFNAMTFDQQSRVSEAILAFR